MASQLINAVPGFKDKRYLELGIHLGQTFKAIIAIDKTSVDTVHPAMFQGTTDEYFAQLDSEEKFDVIYIDACHDYHFVVKDFNDSLKHLNPGGLIFMHDMIPPTEELTKPQFCGTAFRFMYYISTMCLDKDYEYYSLHPDYGDYGISVFVNPTKPVDPPAGVAEVSYAEFFTRLPYIHTRSLDGMLETIRSLK